jgi:hypothetical protein
MIVLVRYRYKKNSYGAGTPVIEMRVLSGITHAQGVCASYAGPRVEL